MEDEISFGPSLAVRVTAWVFVSGLVIIGYILMGQPTAPVPNTVTPPTGPVVAVKPPHPPHTRAPTPSHEENEPISTHEQLQPAVEAETPPAAPEEHPVVQEAVLISHHNLQYPQAALRQGIEGYVVVEFTIMTDGTVSKAQVVDASPSGWFESAAMDEIQSRRYTPQTENGQAVDKPNVRVKLEFKLR